MRCDHTGLHDSITRLLSGVYPGRSVVPGDAAGGRVVRSRRTSGNVAGGTARRCLSPVELLPINPESRSAGDAVRSRVVGRRR